MPHKDDVIRLRHMLEASRDAVSLMQNKDRASLDMAVLASGVRRYPKTRRMWQGYLNRLVGYSEDIYLQILPS